MRGAEKARRDLPTKGTPRNGRVVLYQRRRQHLVWKHPGIVLSACFIVSKLKHNVDKTLSLSSSNEELQPAHCFCSDFYFHLASARSAKHFIDNTSYNATSEFSEIKTKTKEWNTRWITLLAWTFLLIIPYYREEKLCLFKVLLTFGVYKKIELNAFKTIYNIFKFCKQCAKLKIDNLILPFL